MAESTASGMESFSAQEKSTIRQEMARVTLRVSRYVTPVAPRHHGTSLSASASARFSVLDLSFSDSSIMATILS